MKLNAHFILSLVSIIILALCTPKKPDSAEQTSQKSETEKASTYNLEQVWTSDTTFKTPESVIHDETRNVLYVSNVNENPWEKDNNGFISKVSTSGKILDLEWITGFSGPKGMTIIDNILFVADLNELVLVDIEKGEVKEKIVVEGAEGLNDITPDGQGGVYMSDSPAGKIFQYSNAATAEFITDAPGRPNGLLVDQDKLFVAFSQSAEFVSYDLNTKEKALIASDIGHGDGVILTNEANTFLVSDWQGGISIVLPDKTTQKLIDTKDQKMNTADFWYIRADNILLVPTFFDNRIVAFKLLQE